MCSPDSAPRLLLLLFTATLLGVGCGEREEPGQDVTPEQAADAGGDGDVDAQAALSVSALRVSARADRADASVLDGSTLRGSVAIFLQTDARKPLSQVDFYLDDPSRQRAATRSETGSPFDFAATAANGTANLYDTGALATGAHSLTAVARNQKNGRLETVTARFSVGGSGDAGVTPAPTPTPDAGTPAPTPDAGTPAPAPGGTPLPTDPIPPAPAGMRTVAQWEQLFLGVWNGPNHTADFLPWSTSGDSWNYYGVAYGVDANTAMYQATGKSQYVDRALLYVNNMVNDAKVSSSLGSGAFGDSYLGWISQRAEVQGQEVALYESYCWRYVTRLLRVIRETPALYDNASYRAQYDKLLAFSERNIFDKWFNRNANGYVYRVNPHMAGHWALIALNLSRLTTDATRKSTYLTVLNNINHNLPNYPGGGLREQMVAHPMNSAGYFWDATWGSYNRPGQDVSHANGTLAFIVEAHDAGVEWTDADMRAFVVTMNVAIWPAASRFSQYVDGSGTGNGWFNDGMMKLGRYDAALQRRLETHNVGQNSQYYANGALNVRRLSEAGVK